MQILKNGDLSAWYALITKQEVNGRVVHAKHRTHYPGRQRVGGLVFVVVWILFCEIPFGWGGHSCPFSSFPNYQRSWVR